MTAPALRFWKSRRRVICDCFSSSVERASSISICASPFEQLLCLGVELAIFPFDYFVECGELTAHLVQMALTKGSVPLAESVEQEEKADICVDMGFQLIQGYLTGRPIAADSL